MARRLVIIIFSMLLICLMVISKNANADDIGFSYPTYMSSYMSPYMSTYYGGMSTPIAGTHTSVYGQGSAYGFGSIFSSFGQSYSISQATGYTPNSYNMAYNWTSGGGIGFPYGSNLFSMFSPYSSSFAQSYNFGRSMSSGGSISVLGESESGSNTESTSQYGNVISAGGTEGGSMYLPYPSLGFLGDMFSPSLGIGIGVSFDPYGGFAIGIGSAGGSSP